MSCISRGTALVTASPFCQEERRYAYTTPKSFLELIKPTSEPPAVSVHTQPAQRFGG